MTRKLVGFRQALRFLWPRAAETEVDEEIAAHIALQQRRFMEGGMAPDAAHRAAVERFGDIARVRDECRAIRHNLEKDVHRAELRDQLRMDAGFALRTLRRSPLFTLIAVVTVALGVGANAAIFSVVRAVLLRPLPYRNADRTEVLWNSYRGSRASVSAPEYFDMKEQLRAYDEIGAITRQASTITGDGGDPERLMAYRMTPNMFSLLGVTASLGRGFAPGDGAPGSEPVVVLSHALWVRRMGGDPAAVGRRVNVAGTPRTIVGVMPPEVRFPDVPIDWLREPGDLWIPDTWEEARSGSRGNQNLAVLGRLRAGASPEAGRRDLDALQQRFKEAFPGRYAPPAVVGWSIQASALRDDMVGSVRPALLLLTAAVALVLLIACVNVANLLLARGAVRRREMAVRVALGAGRARLLRQLLTESTILAVGGGVLGIALAAAGVDIGVRLAGDYIPRLGGARLDPAVLAFAVALSIVTGLCIGVVPALQQSRADLRSGLGEGARGSTEGRSHQRLRRSLVIAQVAMALVVLVAAGLLGRSFLALERVEPGFRPAGVLTVELTVPATRYDSAAKATRLFTQVREQLAAIAGVGAASGVYPLPMGGEGWSGSFRVEGEPAGPTDPVPHAEYGVALPGYFRAMGIPLLAGREFEEKDRAEAPAVAIVDDRLAERHWPGQAAVGKRVTVNGRDWIPVVGVVGHVHNSGPQWEGEPQLYLPLTQQPQRTLTFVLQTTLPPQSVATAVASRVHVLDRDLAVAKFRSMDDVVSAGVSRQRFYALMIAIFGLTALALASIGLYGVMSYQVAQRTREIGIRLALGGRPWSIRGIVVRQSLTIAATGLVAGTAISLAVSRLITGLLYGIRPTDVVTYGSIVAVLVAVALLAAYGPARRATRIDPVVALRD